MCNKMNAGLDIMFMLLWMLSNIHFIILQGRGEGGGRWCIDIVVSSRHNKGGGRREEGKGMRESGIGAAASWTEDKEEPPPAPPRSIISEFKLPELWLFAI